MSVIRRTLTPSTFTNWATRIEQQRKVVARMISTADTSMAKRRLLLVLKPLDAYPPHNCSDFSNLNNPKHHVDDRVRVHEHAIKVCQDVLQRKLVDWKTLLHQDISSPIRDVDLVVTIGGDGTLLQASHFMDDTIPVLGVNSDPTQLEEVEQFKDEFDASRSTGYLCAATVKNFEAILDDILDNRALPSNIARISAQVNSKMLPIHAVNDILIAHPCPASVSRFSFRLQNSGQISSFLVNCRSSGLRVSTAAGSSAAMLSAGGFQMDILSKDLQYMVREPILQTAATPAICMDL